MKKLFRKLHLWLSVPFGVVITLICFSGAMLVFEREIVQWSNPQLYQVQSVSSRALPMDEIMARAQNALPGDVKIQGVTIYPDPSRTYQISLSKPHKASLFIDQYTGEVKGIYTRHTFFSTMFRLHRWLLGSRPEGDGIFWGKIVVGTSTLLFAIILISGVAIWWPRSVKGLKNSLRINFNRGFRIMLHGLHVAGGIYTLLLLLVMALTGLTWSFGWYRTAFYQAFGVESQQHSGRSRANQTPKNANYENWQKVYENLAASNPGNISITINDGSASVSNNHYGNTRGSDRYKFDPISGEIIENTPYSKQLKSSKMRGWIYSTHTGTFGGISTRILWFLGALLGASLPITGYYLWIKRMLITSKKLSHKNHNKFT